MDTRINYPKLCGYPNDPKWIYLLLISSNHKLHISIFLIINPYNVGIFMDSSSSVQIAPTPFTTNPSVPGAFRCSSSPENSWMKRRKNWQAPFVQWEFQDPKMEVLYHMFGHMNCGGIPWNLALKKGLIYGRYLQSIGPWNGHWFVNMCNPQSNIRIFMNIYLNLLKWILMDFPIDISTKTGDSIGTVCRKLLGQSSKSKVTL
jgi:hypothetical protein